MAEPNRLVLKLKRWTHLSAYDASVLQHLSENRYKVKKHEHLIIEGDTPDGVFLIHEGWAARYKVLGNGKRQFVGLLIPGDLCDIHVFILDRMDHGIIMLSDGLVTRIPRTEIMAAIDNNPSIARALWWTTLVDEGILREWVVNIGCRDAYSRLAHLLCELYCRLSHVGLVHNEIADFGLTQEHLGDALGLTAVHVNRMMMQLRQSGVIAQQGQQLEMIDFDGLKRIAGFESSYLHYRPTD